MRWTCRRAGLLTFMLMVSALARAAEPSPPPVIDAERLSALTRELSSDAFEGRAPGTAGETRTIAWLVEKFRSAGLEPAGPNGSYTQAVPLLRTQVPADASISVTAAGAKRPLLQQRDVAALALRPVDRVVITDAPLVFVGYGVHAPERGWDDYKGVDLRGKVAVYLINDPDFEAVAGDDAFGRFGGRAATYYARWTYKYEEAARRGAIAALIVHETEPAAYGWQTAIAANGEGYDVVRADPVRDKVLLQSWLHRDAAVAILREADQDFDALKRRARSAAFKPVELRGVSLSADFALAHTTIESHNVLGRIPGTPHSRESVMLGAHWDAYGAGEPDSAGRRFRSGAMDDAIGIAGLLEIARALKGAPPPQRTIVFAAWTAEERGLLGSEYYASRPVLPLERTVANLTMDVLQTAGLARDVVLVGAGQNELDGLLERKAAAQGRTVTADAKPERGLAFRADHFPFAKRGVPALLLMGIGGGADLVKGGRAAGDRWVSEYTANCYHQACDRWDPGWDLAGARQDVELICEMTRELANSRAWPQWHTGSEFKTIRDASAESRTR